MNENTKIPVSDFKARALQYFEEISQGRGSVIVTKHGKPMAKVVPFSSGSQKTYKPGALKNTLLHEEDIVSPLGAGLWKAAK